jgi:hypothetical protein
MYSKSVRPYWLFTPRCQRAYQRGVRNLGMKVPLPVSESGCTSGGQHAPGFHFRHRDQRGSGAQCAAHRRAAGPPLRQDAGEPLSLYRTGRHGQRPAIHQLLRLRRDGARSRRLQVGVRRHRGRAWTGSDRPLPQDPQPDSRHRPPRATSPGTDHCQAGAGRGLLSPTAEGTDCPARLGSGGAGQAGRRPSASVRSGCARQGADRRRLR